jgi:hypothetical protein
MSTVETVSPYTDFLYARPSFLEGMARIVDFLGLLQGYNASLTAEAADIRAVLADWDAVGDDFRLALEEYFARAHAQEQSG